MNEHEQLVDRAARHAHTVVFLGGMDAGKSTLARATAAFALRLGRSVAYIDADVAQKTIGPPTTVPAKPCRTPTPSGSSDRRRRKTTSSR
jgi:polynucleotide 5'-kinase involved in rRNA processing